MWSPDGERILFARRENSQTDRYTMAADGTGQIRLTNDELDEGAAGWSPDGQRIGFVTFSDAGGGIVWVMNSDGSQLEDIYRDENAFVGFQAWSPDGRQLMLTIDSAGGGQLDLFLIGVDGTGLNPLTTSQGDEAGGRWSHDGTKIVFWSDGIDPGVYLMNADGTDATRILEDTLGADTVAFAWSPDDSQIAWTAKYAATAHRSSS